jgi:rubrerythrin
MSVIAENVPRVQVIEPDEFRASARMAILLSKRRHKKEKNFAEIEDDIHNINHVGSFWHCLKCGTVPHKLDLVGTYLCCPRCRSPRVKLCKMDTGTSRFVNIGMENVNV